MMKRFLIVSGALFVVASLAFAASPRFTRTLSPGSRGADVTMLQTLLIGIPNIYPNGEATGFFGRLTEAAVKRFQRKYDLPDIGSVGPKTREKLNVLLVSGIIPAAPPAPLKTQPVVVVPPTPAAPVVPAAPADTSSPVIRLLAIGNIARESVMVTWVTNELSSAFVRYGTNILYDNDPIVDGVLRTAHIIKLPRLIPGVLYHVQVQSKDAAGNVSTSDDITFRTLVNELSQSTPGICVVADTQKDLRAIGFGDDNIGVGYLKDRRPGAFTLDELRAGCRAEDFVALANNYCDINPGATIRKYLVTYRGPNDIVDVVDSCPTCAAVQCPLKR